MGSRPDINDDRVNLSTARSPRSTTPPEARSTLLFEGEQTLTYCVLHLCLSLSSNLFSMILSILFNDRDEHDTEPEHAEREEEPDEERPDLLEPVRLHPDHRYDEPDERGHHAVLDNRLEDALSSTHKFERATMLDRRRDEY